MDNSSELLRGLSVEELEALADCLLAPSAQTRLSDLLARRNEQALPVDEETELNRLLQKNRSTHTAQDPGAVHLESDQSGIGRDMTVYIPVELQRRVREQFANCCAYCRTAEDLTATIFEFEHIVPRSAGGETVLDNRLVRANLGE